MQTLITSGMPRWAPIKTDLELLPELNFISSLFVIEREKWSISLTSSLVFNGKLVMWNKTHYKAPTQLLLHPSRHIQDLLPQTKVELSFRSATWSVVGKMRSPEAPLEHQSHPFYSSLVSPPLESATITSPGVVYVECSLHPVGPAHLRDSEVDTRPHSFFRRPQCSVSH